MLNNETYPNFLCINKSNTVVCNPILIGFREINFSLAVKYSFF